MSDLQATAVCRRFDPGGPPCSAACKYHLVDGDLGVPLDEAVAKVDEILAGIIAERPPIAEMIRRVEAVADQSWSETRWSMFDAIAGNGWPWPEWKDLYAAWLHP